MTEFEPYPQPKLGEAATTLTKAAVGSIPLIGAAAAELVGGAVGPIIHRRQVDWLNRLAATVTELGSRRSEWAIENLQSSDAFASAFVTALNAVRATSDEEKRTALRNAVLNSVGPSAPDDDEQSLMLRYLDELTSTHLRVLAVATDSRAWFADQGMTPPTFSISSSLTQVVEAALPDLAGRSELYNQVVRELHARGLTSRETIHGMMTADGAWQLWATPLGQRLLAFISEPDVE